MYDSSLDIFAKKGWGNTFFVNQKKKSGFPWFYKFFYFGKLGGFNF